jgi:hypothetical protein
MVEGGRFETFREVLFSSLPRRQPMFDYILTLAPGNPGANWSPAVLIHTSAGRNLDVAMRAVLPPTAANPGGQLHIRMQQQLQQGETVAGVANAPVQQPPQQGGVLNAQPGQGGGFWPVFATLSVAPEYVLTLAQGAANGVNWSPAVTVRTSAARLLNAMLQGAHPPGPNNEVQILIRLAGPLQQGETVNAVANGVVNNGAPNLAGVVQPGQAVFFEVIATVQFP